MTAPLRLTSGDVEFEVLIDTLIIAGWTGRDPGKLADHIRELQALGVAPPASTPMFYPVAAARLTTSPQIQVLGDDSSGEVECVVLAFGGEFWVGVGSDHTDRKAEAVGISLSKQLCDKPIGRELWRYAEVEPHWDTLVLRAYRTGAGGRELYQDGSVAGLLPPPALIERLGGGLPDGSALFCGTLPAIGGIRGAEDFELVLDDPVLNRTLRHTYSCKTLPVRG